MEYFDEFDDIKLYRGCRGVAAGAELLAVGSGFFNAKDRKAFVQALKGLGPV